MAQAKTGDKVMVHFVGTLEDGTIFDSTVEPLEFKIGQKTMLPAFENAVIGLNTGDTTTVTIPPKDAYGEYEEGHTFVIDRSELPPDFKPQAGKLIQGRSDHGDTIEATIKEINGEKMTMDMNHPLAGKKLTFEITLLKIL